MTVIVKELFKSRETDTAIFGEPGESSGTLLYIVKGTSVEATARTSVLSVAPATWDGKFVNSILLERIAPTKYLARLSYDDRNMIEVGEYRISFDVSGGNVHKTVAFAERRYPDTAPDQHASINVQDGRAQGVDWPVGTLRFTIHYRQPRAVITLAYARALAGLVGKTNSAAFYGFSARELLFLGARGQQGSEVDPEVSYDFLAGEHLANVDIGGITVVLKEAHEFLWSAFEDLEEDDELVVSPKAIYVNTVAQSAAFATILGI